MRNLRGANDIFVSNAESYSPSRITDLYLNRVRRCYSDRNRRAASDHWGQFKYRRTRPSASTCEPFDGRSNGMALLSKTIKDSSTVVSVVSPFLAGTFRVWQLVILSPLRVPDAQPPRPSRSLFVNRSITSWLATYGGLFDHLFSGWFSFGALFSQIKARPSGIGCPSLWDQNSARLAWCGSLQHSRSEPSGTSPWKVAQPSASATWICMCTVVAPFPCAHNVITPDVGTLRFLR